MLARFAVAATLALLATIAAGVASSAPDAETHRCKRGFRHAIIAGSHRCLKVGQRCNRRHDRQYHRYGFHCHNGRLTRRRPPPSPPPPPPPPPPSADLGVTTTDDPDPVRVGSNLTYTVAIANAGPDQADAVQATDTLPVGVTFLSATPSQGSCTGTTTVVCTLGSIAANAIATVTITVQPTASGTISNRANATTSTRDTNAANNADVEETTVLPIPPPTPPPPPPPPQPSCHPSYPDVCIPPPPPDLDCGDIPHRRFRVIHTVPDPDPHGFDGNRDGVGCES